MNTHSTLTCVNTFTIPITWVFIARQTLQLFLLPEQAFEELEELLARHNICIAIKEKLVKDSGVAEDIAYDNIVQKLLTKPRARGMYLRNWEGGEG